MTLYEEGSAAADRRFTGQRWQDTIGLYDYRARWYDPALGRFISADTLVPEPGDPQSLNRFSYVNNNPLRYTDPTGHYLLLEDAAGELSAFALYWTAHTGYRILSGGSHFRNYYERAYGNYYLSGMRTRLPPNPGGAFGSAVIGSATNAYRELWASPQGSWAAIALATDPFLVAGVSSLAARASRELVDVASGVSRSASQTAGGATEEDVVYRYVGPGEARVIQKTGIVPNVDARGRPRAVFYTVDRYESAREAEQKLLIGRLNPAGPYESPTHRVTIARNDPHWVYAGNSGTAGPVELMTLDAARALRVDLLGE